MLVYVSGRFAFGQEGVILLCQQSAFKLPASIYAFCKFPKKVSLFLVITVCYQFFIGLATSLAINPP